MTATLRLEFLGSYGITAEEAVINMRVNLGVCPHREPVAVESIVTGEVVAALCVECDAQLPALRDKIRAAGGSVPF